MTSDACNRLIGADKLVDGGGVKAVNYLWLHWRNESFTLFTGAGAVGEAINDTPDFKIDPPKILYDHDLFCLITWSFFTWSALRETSRGPWAYWSSPQKPNVVALILPSL